MKNGKTKVCAYCAGSMSGLRLGAIYCGKHCRTNATKRRKKIKVGRFVQGDSKECQKCLSAFMPRHGSSKYCSRECSKKARSDLNKLTPKLVRKCAICNQKFQTNSSMHRMCSKECLRIRQRHQRIAGKYGLSAEAFETLLDSQGGGCAICHTKQVDRWAIDHDHSCCPGDSATCGGCVRGVLCFPCNQALGLFKDSAKVLASAMSYLARSNEPGQPGSRY